MKTFFCALLFFFCAANGWAEDRFVDIASNLGVAWEAGHFTQEKNISGLPLPLRSSGEFLLQGDQLLWQTKAPFLSELRFSSEGISQWQNGEKTWEMTVQQQPVIATISQLMLAMMAGQWNTLDHAFRVEVFQLEQNQCWSLHILSKDAVLSTVVDSLQVAGCERVRSIELHEVSGNKTRLDFSASVQGEQ